MKFSGVSIAGVDETVKIEDLATLSAKFPFVEWGVLFSDKRQGKELRYPDTPYISNLIFAANKKPKMQLSAHLCGAVMRNFVRHNRIEFFLRRATFDKNFLFAYAFKRVQLNGWSEVVIGTPSRFSSTLQGFAGTEFIFQVNNRVDFDDHLNFIEREAERSPHNNISYLIDFSGGLGLETLSWPNTENTLKQGYAGGINAVNVKKNIESLLEVTKDREGSFWIDLESGARDSENNFSLENVTSILEQAQPFIQS